MLLICLFFSSRSVVPPQVKRYCFPYTTQGICSVCRFRSRVYLFTVKVQSNLQINVSHFSDISQINNIIGADQMLIYYISASQINDNLTLRINLPLTNDIVNLRFDCI